ncbi:MAG TPA: 3-deoxy-D-manno-octulosonic acid transferase [Thermodesulfovibrionales bacterium]|nr:3-deoxy-D-manno-octulosonic acid transferase [Thermodesulfovibrionales bacterium]
MFLLYSLLYFLVMIPLLPFEFLKRPKGIRQRWFREKRGFLSPSSTSGSSPLIWVHAVSMGEVLSAVTFLRELKRRYPGAGILLSTITDTGQKVAEERLADVADIIYLPFDLVRVIRRVLGEMRPDVFITIETELWPNIFRRFKREGIPVIVMNGRLSERSFTGYRKIRFFMRAVLDSVATFCMQDETSAERMRALGADGSRVAVTGNFKFDMRPPERPPDWLAMLKGPVILAGSTHEGEEEMMVSSFQRLEKDFPGLKLIIAPRHPERFKDVETMAVERGVPCMRKSEILGLSASHGQGLIGRPVSDRGGCPAEKGGPLSGALVIILDTIGELSSAYGACDIAVIGGSFVRHGGHNPLEPALWGKPVLCGPHMENFPFVADFYREAAARETDEERLHGDLEELLQSPEKRKAMGEKAAELYRKKAGAVDRAIAVLERYIKC